MTTITANAVGNTLTGQSGTVAFAGSDSPVFTTTITTPQVIMSTDNGILDDNSNEILALSPAASAVNYLVIGNGATGDSPTIQAIGADTNISLGIMGKGTGGTVLTDPVGNAILATAHVGSPVNYTSAINAATGNAPTLSAIGSDTNINLGLSGKGTGSLTVNNAYTLPAADGTAAYVMTTDGSGNISWSPGGSGNWTLIGTATASNSATLSFTSISAGSYIAHVLVGENLVCAAANNAINIQCSVATVFQAGTSYNAAVLRNTYNASTPAGYNGSSAYNPMTGVGMQGASPYGASFICYFYGASDTSNYKNFNSQCAFLVYNAAYWVNISGGGQFTQTAAVDGLRVLMTAGNITSGKVKLYGLS